MYRRRRWLLGAWGMLVVGWWLCPKAAGDGEAPRSGPPLPAVYVERPPVVDGRLDDACWQTAARAEGFSVVNVDLSPPEETVGLVCVDQTAIYVGFICKDRTPEDIKAVETRRNGEVWDDDWVSVELDCTHQHDQTFTFLVTANGTQAESIPGGSAAKIEWRGDWTAGACRTPDGWTAELAIPFSILRYPEGQQCFGLSLRRRLARERLEMVWPPTGKTWNPLLAADLVGLRPPRLRPRPLWMPYVTADFGEYVGRRFDTGLDVQYRLPSGLTLLAALNPDFKQIEDVVEPIAFSYTERYLEDRRPFFVTGQEGYLPDEHLLYTRRIEDFDAGLKLFGTVGNDSLGVLSATRFGVEQSVAAAWEHKMDAELSTKLSLVSHREVEAPHNLALALDVGWTRHTEEGHDSLWARFYHSHTQGGPSGAVVAVGGSGWRGSGRPHYHWNLRSVSPDFDPALGYYTAQNTVGGSVSVSEWTRYESGDLESDEWDIDLDYFLYRDGSGRYRTSVSAEHSWSWRNGRELWLGLARAVEYNQDSSGATAYLGWNQRDMYRRGGISMVKGRRAGGDYRYLSLDQGFRPTRGLSVRLAVEYSHLLPPAEEAGHQYQGILTVSYDITPEKCLAARAIWRDEGFSAYASYRQVVRRGMDIYLMVGDPDPRRMGFASRLAVKLIWVF